MKIYELVETILSKEKKHPYILAMEGMIGSGKSYEAEKLTELLERKSLLLSTDLFVTVPRSEWARRLGEDGLDLKDWYDLPKIKDTLESIKNEESFKVRGLYNLSNGKFDDELEIEAGGCEYMILEGLFSCNEYLDDKVDLKIFIDVSPETALQRAHERDESVRHLDHNGWLQKKDIFYNHYLPYLEAHKERADIVLEVDD